MTDIDSENIADNVIRDLLKVSTAELNPNNPVYGALTSIANKYAIAAQKAVTRADWLISHLEDNKHEAQEDAYMMRPLVNSGALQEHDKAVTTVDAYYKSLRHVADAYRDAEPTNTQS